MTCACRAEHRYQLGCIDCGAACCPACAVHVESVSYCQACAGTLLGTPVVRTSNLFDLH
jgi:uncharacterized protein (UPF0212 family)